MTIAFGPTGLIFTSEPMVTRALAAELRHNPANFLDLIQSRLGSTGWGGLRSVTCEGVGDLDVVLDFREDNGKQTLVGVEAKFDHEVTLSQLEKELEAVTHLVLVVPEVSDAPEFVPDEVCVLSWAQVLDCLPGSRVTQTDISSMPLSKVAVERVLRRHHLPGLTRAAWDVVVSRGGAGMPSITVRSPDLPDGRSLRGQIQVSGRGRIASAQAARFEYHVGVSVRRLDSDFPPDADGPAPGWVRYVRVLGDDVVKARPGEPQISRRAPTAGQEPLDENAIWWGARKMGVVARHLSDLPWVAKGYTDWALGVRSKPVRLAELDALCAGAERLFLDWHAAIIDPAHLP